MTEKEIFIEKLKTRTKRFAVDVINFCNSLKPVIGWRSLVTRIYLTQS